jgi:hypothetical protein
VDKKAIFLKIQEQMIRGLVELLPERRRDLFINFYIEHFAKHFRTLLEWIEKTDGEH